VGLATSILVGVKLSVGADVLKKSAKAVRMALDPDASGSLDI
jgi:hypothetical protein